ncbi:MAG: ABC-type branched-chain amino acid transport system, permease component [Acidimicrobiaceae bacterium]|nr:ABC-type branched-chain amino acid transport system, permease component [Acidimicrobiaceae bacterium]
MLQYIVIGVVIGGIYAIFAAGLITTFQASGILNFGYGAIAFFIARTYYFLLVQHQWPIWAAALISILVIAPAMGFILWAALFRILQQATTLVKVVATIGLSVMLPALAGIIYGNPVISFSPGLVPYPVPSYTVLGVGISLDQINVVACVVLILVVGFVVVNMTEWGLVIRALVDSPAQTSLTGTNPKVAAAAVWTIATCFAGLAGVLIAPILGVNSDNYEFLIVAAFSAVLLARFINIGVAILASIALGVVSSLLNLWLPPTGTVSTGVIASVPFAFIFIFVLYEAVRRKVPSNPGGGGGALDRAITTGGAVSASHDKAQPSDFNTRPDFRLSGWRRQKRLPTAITALVILLLLPVLLSPFWTGRVALGLAFGIVFLSLRIVMGEGGTIWLCQASFAGVGAMVSAYLITDHQWPLIPAIVVAALLTALGGSILAYLTTRLGDLYVALVTLAFGILVDRLIFTIPVFQGSLNAGIPLVESFATNDTTFFYILAGLTLAVVLFVEHFRQSTAGLALSATRWSEPSSRALGLSVVQIKVLAACLSAVIAAVGGAFIALSYQYAVPATFDTIGALVWIAVFVTVGVRSTLAAVVAGILSVVTPAIFQTFFPTSISDLPPVLFGLGAVLLANNPEGVLIMHAEQGRRLIAHTLHAGRRIFPTVEARSSDVVD